jgi:hypothetical protein
MEWHEKNEKIELNFPVKWGEGDAITELEFSPLTGQQMMGMTIDTSGKMEMGQMIEIGGKLCTHESGISVIKKLHAQDIMKVVTLVGNFLDDGQETGA